MARKNKVEEASELDVNAWMVTFSDLLMLMLTFFVMLLTMSSMDAQELAKITRRGVSLPSDDPESAFAPSPPSLITPPPQVAELRDILSGFRQGYLNPRLEEAIEELLVVHELRGMAWAELRPEGLLINIDGSVAFEPGSERLSERSRSFLADLATVAAPTGLNLAIEAYVDLGPSLQERDDSWELALNRAETTTLFMAARDIEENHLRMAGYGYEGGRDELGFVRYAELLRVKVLTGPTTVIEQTL